MDFFKSVFADDPDPSSDDVDNQNDVVSTPDPDPTLTTTNSRTGAWSFGGLMNTLATKSESVMQNYRRDLAELGSGLKSETAVIREVASRAVKELPSKLEVGASVAQVSLERVGEAIDDIGSSVWKSTAEIIAHGKDAISAVDGDDDSGDNSEIDNRRRLSSSGSDLRRYSRFESQMSEIQSNRNTYLEEPEDLDLESYESWKLGFVLGERGEEIENLKRESVVGEIYEEIVPARVDSESFWLRYFYRVNRLKEVEDARAKLVNRAMSGNEEEDLSWDFDDEDGEDGSKEKPTSSDDAVNAEVVARESVSSDKSEAKSDSCKESDISIVSSQPSMPEEDLGWDEIEDIGSGDEKKGGEVVGSTSRADLRKRIGAAEEQEEDFSWDIEDDDDDKRDAIKS